MAVKVKVRKKQQQLDEGLITIIGGLFKLILKTLTKSFGLSADLAKGIAGGVAGVFKETPEQKQLAASGQIPPEAMNQINEIRMQTIQDLKDIIEQEKQNIQSGRSREGNINLINRIESKCEEYRKNVEKTLMSYVGKQRGQQAASVFNIDTTQFENALSELTRFRMQVAQEAVTKDTGLKQRIIDSLKTTKIGGGGIPNSEIDNIADMLLAKAVDNAKPMRTIGFGKFQTKMRENADV